MTYFVEFAFWSAVTGLGSFGLWVTYLCYRDAPAFFEERRERRSMDALVRERMAARAREDWEVAQLEAIWEMPARPGRVA